MRQSQLKKPEYQSSQFAVTAVIQADRAKYRWDNTTPHQQWLRVGHRRRRQRMQKTVGSIICLLNTAHPSHLDKDRVTIHFFLHRYSTPSENPLPEEQNHEYLYRHLPILLR